MIRRIARTSLREPPRSLHAAALLAALPAPAARGDSEALQDALRALLSDELALRPEHIRAVVERELLRQRRARTVTLSVNPDDLPLLDHVDAYRNRLELAFTLDVQPDATVARGGCTVRSNLGEVDARLETRLDAALELLAAGAFDAP